MGKYINTTKDGKLLDHTNKVGQLINDGAEIIPQPLVWEKDLVCVAENGAFDAAAYIFNQQELEAFVYPCGRRKTWLKLEGAKNLAF